MKSWDFTLETQKLDAISKVGHFRNGMNLGKSNRKLIIRWSWGCPGDLGMSWGCPGAPGWFSSCLSPPAKKGRKRRKRSTRDKRPARAPTCQKCCVLRRILMEKWWISIRGASRRLFQYRPLEDIIDIIFRHHLIQVLQT